MTGTRAPAGHIAVAGMLFACCLTALATHAVLDLGEESGFLASDYGSYAHCMVGPVALGAMLAGAIAFLVYALHLFDAQTRSLPLLARALERRCSWKAVAATAIAGAALLAGMESIEQLASGHFDGIASAFGSMPAIGAGLIVLFSAAVHAAMRACCRWLARAHARIVAVFITLLRPVEDGGPLIVALSRRPVAAEGSYLCHPARIHGKRAPPTLR
ncbi:MAG TPA: hypothetical protein VMD47_07335 [Candidatus Acidoferrales bacterium]|nr:hypothetical protein [Candidatus Acidoferrales bacterium]